MAQRKKENTAELTTKVTNSNFLEFFKTDSEKILAKIFEGFEIGQVLTFNNKSSLVEYVSGSDIKGYGITSKEGHTLSFKHLIRTGNGLFPETFGAQNRAKSFIKAINSAKGITIKISNIEIVEKVFGEKTYKSKKLTFEVVGAKQPPFPCSKYIAVKPLMSL